MSEGTGRSVLWWLCLFFSPLVLLVIELFHPAGFTTDPGMFAYLSQPESYSPQHGALAYFGPGWWFTLHMIQTVLMGLVAVGLWLLVDSFGPSDRRPAGILAWLSRVAAFVFLIYYTALDSIGGSGLGRTIEHTLELAREGNWTPADIQKVAAVLDATWIDPWVGGVGSFISETGSWAVFIAALAAAGALLAAKKAPWPPLVLLVAFGWELQVSHAAPHGPIAFALLLIAAFWLWRVWRRPAGRMLET
ncbi:MAG TPA: hypothetical protein VGC93_13565 [Thermoanaerobaculia bacterium]